MQAVFNGQVVAKADKKDLIFIEGNWYFPPDSLKKEFFSESTRHSDCFWKGKASYYNVEVDDAIADAGAWYYPKLKKGAVEMVKKDFTDYVAFWNGVTVQED